MKNFMLICAKVSEFYSIYSKKVVVVVLFFKASVALLISLFFSSFPDSTYWPCFSKKLK